MSRVCYLFIFLTLMSCIEDNEADIVFDNKDVLSDFLLKQNYIEDVVIACAASNEYNNNLVNVYFYPEEKARDFKLYESNSNNIKGTDFSRYNFVELKSKPFFNGTLQLFETESNAEWLVIVYNVNDTIKIATPIKNKKKSQRTLWTDQVDINQQQSGMPLFHWDINSEEDNAIFFQVLATENLDLLSGTYTTENRFQYYKLNNVVLNITQSEPPQLILGNNYVFTLMDVSIDNWVNEVIMTSFVAE